MHSHDFPEPSFQSVPIHDPVAVLRNDDSRAGIRNRGSGDEHVEVTRLPPLPPSEQRPDLVGRSYACIPWETKATVASRCPIRSQSRGGRAALLLGNGHGQPKASLTATRIDHLSATLGGHAGAESMLIDALTIARTIGRLHLNPLRELPGAELCFGKDGEYREDRAPRQRPGPRSGSAAARESLDFSTDHF